MLPFCFSGDAALDKTGRDILEAVALPRVPSCLPFDGGRELFLIRYIL